MTIRTSFITCLKSVRPEWFLYLLVGRGGKLPTHTTPKERILLYDEATLSYKDGTFLEIGSYLGASAVILAEALRRKSSQGRRGRVLCIDTWNNDAMSEGARDTWGEFEQNTAKWKEYIVPINGRSSDVAVPSEEQFDLLFIDGDHSYPAVKADVNRFAPRVRQGGRIVFHDQDRSSVATVVGEVLQTGSWCVSGSVERMISLRRL
jgi:predicted O-methyltransferase YrrM